jgi:hypothetical protein
VQVQDLERHCLAVAPAGRTALDPEVGPIEACRIETVARRPMWRIAWPRPMVVVVLPSPSGVGVTAVTTT